MEVTEIDQMVDCTHDTSLFSTPKSFAISVMHNDTVKKSKASHVQPRKPTQNISHWWRSSWRRISIGLRR